MKNSVSVIIPVYNAEKFIRKTLISVLNQTYALSEIIVVDDGSTDNTASIVKEFKKISYYYQENQGVATALNKGIEASKGDFLAFLDHDDIWLEKKTERQMHQFENDPSIDISFTFIENFLCPNIDTKLAETIDFSPKPMIGIHKSSFLVRRSSFLEVGLFSTKNKTQELLDWYAKSKDKKLKEHILAEVLVKRRIHGTNQTLLNKEFKSDFPRVLKAILDRRRRKAL